MLHVGPAAGALVEGALVGGVGEHAVGLAGTEATSAAAATTTAAAAATAAASATTGLGLGRGMGGGGHRGKRLGAGGAVLGRERERRQGEYLIVGDEYFFSLHTFYFMDCF